MNVCERRWPTTNDRERLQCWRERPRSIEAGSRRRASTRQASAPPFHLCRRSYWIASHGGSAACADHHPLLAVHSLERALTVTHREPLAVVCLGPTASGKSALALAIARRFGGEIVNCDSVAMYREFEIGTAKPIAAERAEVPHHLVDCEDPLADVSAGEYARQARQVLREIQERKHLPIVSGGTGLYLRALLEGLFSGPLRSEELRDKLRGRAEKYGTGHLHRILRRLDASAADRIHAHDVPKMIRAIEVCLASRRPMTELWRQGREPLQGFRILRLGLNPEREVLYARINQCAAKWSGSRRWPRRSRRIATMPSARSHGSGANRMCIGWPGLATTEPSRRNALQPSSGKSEIVERWWRPFRRARTPRAPPASSRSICGTF